MGQLAQLALTLGDVDRAIALDRQGIELDPLNASRYLALSYALYRGGRLEEAVAGYTKGKALAPSSVAGGLGLVYLAQSRPQEALAEFERAPHLSFRLQGQALAYHALGRKQESDAALQQLIARGRVTSAFQIAEVYAFRGETDRAFEWLERAYIQRDLGFGAPGMKCNPLLKSLERDPRWTALLKKLRLPA